MNPYGSPIIMIAKILNRDRLTFIQARNQLTGHECLQLRARTIADISVLLPEQAGVVVSSQTRWPGQIKCCRGRGYPRGPLITVRAFRDAYVAQFCSYGSAS